MCNLRKKTLKDLKDFAIISLIFFKEEIYTCVS